MAPGVDGTSRGDVSAGVGLGALLVFNASDAVLFRWPGDGLAGPASARDTPSTRARGPVAVLALALGIGRCDALGAALIE